MGRIKSKLIKRISLQLFEKYSNEFATDFNANKGIILKFIDLKYKRLRNPIAGYLTRLAKRAKDQEIKPISEMKNLVI